MNFYHLVITTIRNTFYGINEDEIDDDENTPLMDTESFSAVPSPSSNAPLPSSNDLYLRQWIEYSIISLPVVVTSSLCILSTVMKTTECTPASFTIWWLLWVFSLFSLFLCLSMAIAVCFPPCNDKSRDYFYRTLKLNIILIIGRFIINIIYICLIILLHGLEDKIIQIFFGFIICDIFSTFKEALLFASNSNIISQFSQRAIEKMDFWISALINGIKFVLIWIILGAYYIYFKKDGVLLGLSCVVMSILIIVRLFMRELWTKSRCRNFLIFIFLLSSQFLFISLCLENVCAKKIAPKSVQKVCLTYNLIYLNW